jgi:hypothetical protein
MYPTAEAWAITETVLGLVLVAASIAVWRRQIAPPLWVSVLAALCLRVAVAIISRGHIPDDAAADMARVARTTLAHQDALTRLHAHDWNFVPFMNYVLAGEWRMPVPWQLAVKISPIAADVVTVWLLGLVAVGDRRRVATARFLYALSPVALLVAAHHGQIEPIGVALGLAALALAQRRHALGAGAFLGLAIACQTWPVLFAPGVLRELPRRRWPVAAGTAAVVVGLLFSTVRWVLHDSLHRAAHVITSFRSYIGTYGWSGLLHLYGDAGAGYSGPHIDGYQHLATVVLAVTLVVLLVLFRRAAGPELTMVLLLAALAVAAGFGAQYLIWPAALLYARGLPRGALYLIPASLFAMFIYLVALPAPIPHPLTEIRGVDIGQVWGSLPVIAGALAAIPWEKAGEADGMPVWRWQGRRSRRGL